MPSDREIPDNSYIEKYINLLKIIFLILISKFQLYIELTFPYQFSGGIINKYNKIQQH